MIDQGRRRIAAGAAAPGGAGGGREVREEGGANVLQVCCQMASTHCLACVCVTKDDGVVGPP